MVFIHAVSMLNALGNTLDEIAQNVQQGYAPFMQSQSGWLVPDQPCMLGSVQADLPPIPDELKEHDSRNNQLLLASLKPLEPLVAQAMQRYGHDRIAIVLGTSTSGLEEADHYISACHHHTTYDRYHYYEQELGDPSRFLSRYLKVAGPAYTISTACSSSARAILAGQRLIDAGLADVAIVGGTDTLSRMPINGFHSLDALSTTPCHPFAKNRSGINIGEASALLFLSKEPAPIAFLGGGESSDGYHMSAPEPNGTGAQKAIIQALEQARLTPSDIGYINLHGTGTVLNDRMESAVTHRLFGPHTPCSSTKHLTGHTLGAAGATEAALCYLLLDRDLPLPTQVFTPEFAYDDSLDPCHLVTTFEKPRTPFFLSNSFAFGGNNCSLIIGKP